MVARCCIFVGQNLVFLLTANISSINLIDRPTAEQIKSVKVPRDAKVDPELGGGLSPKGRERKELFLKLGLSTTYVKLCFEAYRKNIISAARMAEILLVDELTLKEIADLYGEELRYGN
jgi:hypothetical protein